MIIEPIQSITTGEGENQITYAVADLSPELKQMVSYLNDWRQQEADQVSALLLTRAALETMQNKILQQLQTEAEAKTAAEQDAQVPKVAG